MEKPQKFPWEHLVASVTSSIILTAVVTVFLFYLALISHGSFSPSIASFLLLVFIINFFPPTMIGVAKNIYRIKNNTKINNLLYLIIISMLISLSVEFVMGYLAFNAVFE